MSDLLHGPPEQEGFKYEFKGIGVMPKIIPHKHCVVCGKAIEAHEVYCSDDCEKSMKDSQKKQRIFFIVLFALILFMMFISYMAPKG